MTSFIPRQPKQTRERVEAKLDRDLIRKLECYCQYLDSDRAYVISKALEIVFRKDRGFAEWLKTQGGNGPMGPAEPQAEKRERKTA